METITPVTEPVISFYGWSLLFLILTVMLLNLLIARHLTVRLLKKKYIRKNSPEFSKAMIAWFMPVVGALSLLMLLWTHNVIAFCKRFSKWLTLSHI